MECVELCDRNGQCKKFSRLVMGTDHLIQGGWTGESQREPTKDEVFLVLDKAAKHRINIFDTAPLVAVANTVLDKWQA